MHLTHAPLATARPGATFQVAVPDPDDAHGAALLLAPTAELLAARAAAYARERRRRAPR